MKCIGHRHLESGEGITLLRGADVEAHRSDPAWFVGRLVKVVETTGKNVEYCWVVVRSVATTIAGVSDGGPFLVGLVNCYPVWSAAQWGSTVAVPMNEVIDVADSGPGARISRDWPEPLDAMIAESEEAIARERARLISCGVDPAVLDAWRAEIEARPPPTDEERARVASTHKAILAAVSAPICPHCGRQEAHQATADREGPRVCAACGESF